MSMRSLTRVYVTQPINSLRSKLNGMSKSCFGFAGTKDKRAVTTQLMSAFRLQPQRLLQVACVTYDM